MAVDFSTNFNSYTDGTTLPANDSEWTDRNITTDVDNPGGSAGTAQHTGADNTGDASACHIQSSTLTDSNYYVQCEFDPGALNEFHGLVARRSDFDTVDNDGYFAFANSTSNELELYSRVSGGWDGPLEGAKTVTLVDGTFYTLKMVVDTTATFDIVVSVDGTDYIESTDTAITAKGDCGLGLGTGQSAVDDCHWDDFEAGTLVDAAAPYVEPLPQRLVRHSGRYT